MSYLTILNEIILNNVMPVNEDLLKAFEQKKFGKFQELIQVFQADPNYFVESQDRTIFEIILNTPGSSNFIKLCIESGADFYMVRNSKSLRVILRNLQTIEEEEKNSNNFYPLHCVIRSQCLENLKQVERFFTKIHTNLKSFSYNQYYINVKTDNGENSLHILANSLANYNFETTFEMMKVILSHGCNPNFPNSDGKTAFHVFLEKLPTLTKKSRQYGLEYFLNMSNVDFYTHNSEEIIELVMNENIKFEIPPREEHNVGCETMVQLLSEIKINKFETLFPFFKSSCEDNEVYADWCAMLMEIAIERSLINIVAILIDYGVDVNRIAKHSTFKAPPIFLAFSKSNPYIAKLFLMHPKIKLSFDNADGCKTLLHQFFDQYKKLTYSMFRRLESREIEREMLSDQKKCFDLLMTHPKCNRNLINAYDDDGKPAIFHSIRYKTDYITLQLLKRGAYIGTVINCMRKTLLEEFLNSTITTNHRFSDDKDLEIKIDYSFLTPPRKDVGIPKRRRKKLRNKCTTITIPKSEKQSRILGCDVSDEYSKEMETLKEIAESEELHQFLAHPTISSFILLKFNKLSFIIYINMILIMIFMLTFITYSVICQTMPIEERSSSFLYIFFQVLSFISLATVIAIEVINVMILRRQYVLDYTNWIDIAFISSALMILFFQNQLSNHGSRLLRTFVILLAAAQFFTFLGMVPIMSVSIYTKMYKKVMQTFIKSLAFYSVMILAFAFGFYTLQGDKFSKDIIEMHRVVSDNTKKDGTVTNYTRSERYNNFYTVGSSIIKSFVMLSGELEGSYVQTEGFAYAILFMLFIFLVTIVLYNLLNALAVSDTQEIKRDAKLIDLKQRIITMYENEHAIFKRNTRVGNWLKMVISMFPKTLPEGNIMIKPNKNSHIYVKNFHSIILNDWLHNRLKFLHPKLQFSADIMKEIQNLLTTRHEEQKNSKLTKLKEGRSQKYANDVIKITEMINDIQVNIKKIEADVYSLRKKAIL